MSGTPTDQHASSPLATVPTATAAPTRDTNPSATDYAVAPGEYLREWIDDTDTRAEDAAFSLNLLPEELTLFLAGEYAVTVLLLRTSRRSPTSPTQHGWPTTATTWPIASAWPPPAGEGWRDCRGPSGTSGARAQGCFAKATPSPCGISPTTGSCKAQH